MTTGDEAARAAFPDWQWAPNIAGDPARYELENRAIARDGRLDAALRRVGDWTGRTVLDVGCGVGHWGQRMMTLLPEEATLVGIDAESSWMDKALTRATARGLGAAVLAEY